MVIIMVVLIVCSGSPSSDSPPFRAGFDRHVFVCVYIYIYIHTHVYVHMYVYIYIFNRERERMKPIVVRQDFELCFWDGATTRSCL